MALVLLMSRQRVIRVSFGYSHRNYIRKYWADLPDSMVKKIIKITISDALSKRLKTKFGISTDLVLHDA